MNPKISIIIPVRNRAEYLKHTLETCIKQDYENYEIIVANDASTDNTAHIVKSAAERCEKILYITRGSNQGMLENFEHALNNVNGDYVLALGGDDGLMPGALNKIAKIIQEKGAELIAWDTPIYSYPNTRTENGQIIIPYRGKDRFVDSKEFLEKLYQTLSYTTARECPMFYVKGIASTKLIELVKSKSPNRRFYNCPTPDGYSGVALAGFVSRFYYTGDYITLHGLSSQSQGLSYLSGAKEAIERSTDFFEKVAGIPMHAKLGSQPYSPLITLMTADYLLSASDVDGWVGPKVNIDYKRIIDKAFLEMENGLFSLERVDREMEILSKIARLCHLDEYFEWKQSRFRKRAPRRAISGDAVNFNSIFIDALQAKVRNVHEASIFISNISSFSASFLSPKSLVSIVYRSLLYKMRSLL
jgi:glycosyltransferase involved in cell wall biosynthesis